MTLWSRRAVVAAMGSAWPTRFERRPAPPFRRLSPGVCTVPAPAPHQVLVTAGVALDAQKPVFEQAALQVVVELLLDEMRQGCAFGLQPGKKLRVAGLDDTIERRLFRSVAFVDVAVGTAGSKQSSQPASAWVDKAGKRRTTYLSAWTVPGWRRRARFDVGILLTSPGDPDVDAIQALCSDSERWQLTDAVFYLHAPDGTSPARSSRRRRKEARRRRHRAELAHREQAAGAGGKGMTLRADRGRDGTGPSPTG